MLTSLDVVARLQGEADQVLAGRLEGLVRRGQAVTCRAGCAHCCRQLVVISPLEAHALAAYVEASGREGEFRERITVWEARVAEHPGLGLALQAFRAAEGYPSSETGSRLESEYWAARLECPFLDGDRCGVYPARPFACREHHVTSDPELCREDLDAPTVAPTRLEYRTLSAWIGVEQLRLPDRQLPLPEALEYSRTHPEARAAGVGEAELGNALLQGRRRLAAALSRLGIRGDVPRH